MGISGSPRVNSASSVSSSLAVGFMDDSACGFSCIDYWPTTFFVMRICSLVYAMVSRRMAGELGTTSTDCCGASGLNILCIISSTNSDLQAGPGSLDELLPIVTPDIDWIFSREDTFTLGSGIILARGFSAVLGLLGTGALGSAAILFNTLLLLADDSPVLAHGSSSPFSSKEWDASSAISGALFVLDF